ncbi:acetyltransferase [Caulobacter vibrioides]|nr:acetyltransferase [Caulobacter vibrioides]
MNSAPAPILQRPARVVEIETIRDLERASAQRFLGLMDAIAADEPTPAPLLARRIVEGGLLVAEIEATVVAFVMFRPLEGGLYVEQLDVLPSLAGRRIGAALLDAVAERANGGDLTLSTFRDVPWNAPYYARLGFEVADGLTPGMAAIRAEHLARGLDEDARVFMRRPATKPLSPDGRRRAAQP